MILTALGPITAYRTHTPRWAVAPTSGAGAATHVQTKNAVRLLPMRSEFERLGFLRWVAVPAYALPGAIAVHA